MPKIVKIKLIVNGEEFLPKSGYSVSVEQSVGGHSAFRITFPSHATEGYEGVLMDNALKFVGKKAAIGLDEGKMEFSGVVTAVDFQKGIGALGTIVLSGHGPAVLLANSVQCFSYPEGTALSQVANDTISGHSGEHLKSAMGKGTDVKLPYTVQYNESDLSFLQRLCSRYGVWLYYNGSEFCVGRTGDKQVKGTVGVDVLSFNLSSTLREQSFGLKGHDWVNDNLLESESSVYAQSSSHPYLDWVKGQSDTLFSKKGSYDYTIGQHEYSAQRGLDMATKVNTFGKSAGMVIASGISELTELCIGDTLSLKGLNFSDPKKKDPYGSYEIIKIVHRFDHSGHYRNEFEGVSEGSKHLPYSNSFSTPNAGAQRGRVFDNADPEGLGRIKVQFPWQRAMGTSTPWIKMATPYSGGGKGFYFIPEKEEEVLVGFEGDNPEKPFVLSAGYNTNASSGFADADNNIKAIKTRSGNLIELNDTDGGEMITIQDKNGNSMHINTTEGKMVFTALGDMEFNAKNMKFNVQEDMNVEVGKNKKESVMETSETTAKNWNENIMENKTAQTGKKFEQISGELIVHTSQGEMLLDGTGKVTIQSKQGIDYGN